MNVVEVTNLIASAAESVLLDGFELVVDENLAWKPAHGKVRMWVEPQGAEMTELSGRQAKELCRVTFIAYTRENVGQGTATAQTSAIADAVNGPFRLGCVLRPATPGSIDYLNGVGGARTWIPGKDAQAYPGLFAAAALVNLDHYARAAAA